MTFIRKKRIRNNYYYYLVKSIRTGKNSWKKYEKYIGKTLPKEKPEFEKELKKEYDVIIIGAGPAGLFAAYELSKEVKSKILVIEKGKDVHERKDVLEGVGGSGLFSDGKLNLTPVHGKTNLFEFLPREEAYRLVHYIDNIFVNFGAPESFYSKNIKKIKEIKEKARKYGIVLLLARQKHLGSDKLPILIKKFVDHLKKNNVEFLLDTPVKEIIVKNNKTIGVKTDKGIINSNYIIACPGRVGSNWFLEQTFKLKIPSKHRGIEVGVRVEIKANLMKHITNYIWDPAFFMESKRYKDTVRTFCTCPNGFVSSEKYENFIGVNGHCMLDKKTSNTNFALLSNMELTKPATNTIAYGESIGKLATTIAGGKPFIQRLADLKKHRRSTWQRINKSKIKPTLKEATPGDLSMAMPGRVVFNILDVLEQLSKIINGLNKDVLLYGPEIKFFSVKIDANKNLETRINGLFVAGDGVGVSGNIVGAAATGVIAARGVLKKIQIHKTFK